MCKIKLQLDRECQKKDRQFSKYLIYIYLYKVIALWSKLKKWSEINELVEEEIEFISGVNYYVDFPVCFSSVQKNFFKSCL